MKITVDKSLCIGDGSCAEVCPEVFAIGPDGLAYVIEGTDPDSAGDRLKDAAEGCPVSAIIFED